MEIETSVLTVETPGVISLLIIIESIKRSRAFPRQLTEELCQSWFHFILWMTAFIFCKGLRSPAPSTLHGLPACFSPMLQHFHVADASSPLSAVFSPSVVAGFAERSAQLASLPLCLLNPFMPILLEDTCLRAQIDFSPFYFLNYKCTIQVDWTL